MKYLYTALHLLRSDCVSSIKIKHCLPRTGHVGLQLNWAGCFAHAAATFKTIGKYSPVFSSRS